LVAVALAVNYDLKQQFSEFQTKYSRKYASIEETEKKFKIFSDNMKIASDLQKLNPLATFGVNDFADISHEEFSSQYLMTFDFEKNYVAPPPMNSSVKPTLPEACSPTPHNWDWNECGVITPVYNQGQCGSCWAFSATETIESYYALKGYALTQLSMEQIVDCDTTCGGCAGGYPAKAYEYVYYAGGIESYAAYPYTAESGYAGSCDYDSQYDVADVTYYYDVDGELGLYKQLSSGGPVSVCVDASTWQTYTGGILTTCGTTVDHCVQATGYAKYGESGAYWIVRNSWGTSWGIDGYIAIEIGKDLCDIGDYGTFVVAD